MQLSFLWGWFFLGGCIFHACEEKTYRKSLYLMLNKFAAEIQSNPIQSLLTLITLKCVSENRIDKVDLKIIIAD